MGITIDFFEQRCKFFRPRIQPHTPYSHVYPNLAR
jgi:hypothetical protein